ncbi:hypothetical protein [Pantanalinema sp. GBBB05]|uniref:hypothetical protein n=1 Tax=Pantanalinema sp. GBBB05 TaxID=2604139 RepID=UPI001DCEFAF7|nr:hypothetical protein [Pantanalinema sp. GBBB05]
MRQTKDLAENSPAKDDQSSSEQVELDRQNRLLQLAVLLTASVLALLGVLSWSIQAKLLQLTTSEFLGHLDGWLLVSSALGLLLVQLAYKQLGSEREQVGYLSISITACLLLSAVSMLLFQPARSLQSINWANPVFVMALIASTLSSLEEDKHPQAKKLLDRTSLLLSLVAIGILIIFPTHP